MLSINISNPLQMKNFTKTFLVIFSATLLAACGSSQESNADKEMDMRDSVELAKKPYVEGREVRYTTDSTTMTGYLAYDSNIEGKRAGILIVHEWWGHTDHVRKRADMLAELGYVGFALDMYGDGKKADHPDDAMKYSQMVMSNMDGAKARFEEAYKQLASDPHVDPNKISVIGYCFGGAVALSMANAGEPLDGVAIFHSSVQVAIPPSDKLKAKILVQNGGDDPFISPESIAKFKSQMDSLDVDYEYISYPGAQHGFTNTAATELGEKFEMPISYNQKADTVSWNKLKTFLNDLYPNN